MSNSKKPEELDGDDLDMAIGGTSGGGIGKGNIIEDDEAVAAPKMERHAKFSSQKDEQHQKQEAKRKTV